jgi:acyl-CoA thioester hydrolase
LLNAFRLPPKADYLAAFMNATDPAQAASPSPDSFPVQLTVPVAWGDMDALAHVNNTVYFRYFESARIAFFEQAGRVTLPEATSGPILADTRCRFVFPLTYPDRITIGTRIRSWGRTSVVMEHAIWSKDGRLAAFGEAVIVWFDYKTQAKQVWPAPVKEALDALGGRKAD